MTRVATTNNLYVTFYKSFCSISVSLVYINRVIVVRNCVKLVKLVARIASWESGIRYEFFVLLIRGIVIVLII